MADLGDESMQEVVDRQAPVVQWYGTHPAENIPSMDVYRESLLREVSPKDDFEFRCWPEAGSWDPKVENSAVGTLSRLVRAVKKYPGYTRRVRNTPRDTAIVHFLDHSMAHLLPQVPFGMKTVVTVHDLIPLGCPGEQTPAQHNRFRRNAENLVRADAIIAVSEFAKSEIVAHLGIDSGQITVVPNGVSVPDEIPRQCAAVDQLRASGADAVLLSVGTTLQRKNLQILPAALKAAGEKNGKQLALIRVGDRLHTDLAKKLKLVLGENLLIELGRVDETTLWSAYRAADVLVLPSLSEGFGLPVLEALACGTSVAASKVASVPEVGGKVAEYFDPGDPVLAGAAIARAMETANRTANETARAEHAAGFTWQSHLLACKVLYRELTG